MKSEKKQRDVDSMFTKLKNLEQKQRENEKQLKSDILDLKSRSMRDNLLFYGVPEEKDESDAKCVQKVLDFIESKCDIENASQNIKLHRAHRIGRFNQAKMRPIVAKFAYYQDRENVRKCANKLQYPLGVSQQFPREIVETRKRLIPIMKKARSEGKDVTTRFVIKTRFVIIYYKTGWENIITIRVDSYNPFCNKNPNCNKTLSLQ